MSTTLNLGIKMNQGDDFYLVMLFKDANGPIDITGYSFLGDMKLNTAPTSPVVAAFSFAVLDQVTKTGQASWSLSNSATLALISAISDAEQEQRKTTPFVFDVKVKDVAGKIKRRIQGIIYLSPVVTQRLFT